MGKKNRIVMDADGNVTVRTKKRPKVEPVEYRFKETKGRKDSPKNLAKLLWKE